MKQEGQLEKNPDKHHKINRMSPLKLLNIYRTKTVVYTDLDTLPVILTVIINV